SLTQKLTLSITEPLTILAEKMVPSKDENTHLKNGQGEGGEGGEGVDYIIQNSSFLILRS
ncbi:MAG: hypothetical protein AAFW70_30545, partial [Cyanobacteria bacterium J06635_10]